MKDKIPTSPEEVDALIVEYEGALNDLAVLDEYAAERKQHLIRMVELCGTVPANATVSKRLAGIRKSVLVTWGTMVVVDEEAVSRLKATLIKRKLQDLFSKLFAEQAPPVYVPPPPTHRRVGDVYQELMQLPKRLSKKAETRIAALYSACLKQKPKAPALKIETAG